MEEDGLSRRTFLKVSAATAAALAIGHRAWGDSGSPFGPLQDDLLIRLPEGFSYQIVAEAGTPLTGGRGPHPRPPFPDLNVVFPQPGGRILLSTSHEIPDFFPLFATNPPGEDYDRIASGAVTSLLLNPDLTIAESAYNAGGMITNCSGSGTPWGTVLTGEESTASFEADHGFVWEVDPNDHTKVRLDLCGRFEHETAVVDPQTGFVYLTEDDSTALLYRFRPDTPGRLDGGGVLEAYGLEAGRRAPGKGKGRAKPRGDAGGFVPAPGWATIDDPLGESGLEPHDQGLAKGALRFRRCEGGAFDGRWFYFTETQDASTLGRVWRLNVDTEVLELYAEGSESTPMIQPDNIAFDAAGNLFVCEDRADASFDLPNRLWFIDRQSGEMAVFAELVQKYETPEENIADEPTGSVFSPDGSVLFLNLQRDNFGVTLAITGPFAGAQPTSQAAALPKAMQPAESAALASMGPSLGGLTTLPLAAAAGLVNLRRRGQIPELNGDLEGLARDLGEPPGTFTPKRGDDR